MTVEEDFLGELNENESTPDILNESLEEAKPTEVENTESTEDEDGDGRKAKNRRERRLLKHEQELREEALMYKAKLDAISEMRAPQAEVESDFLKSVERIYGSDTPEAKAATDILKQALQGVQNATRKDVIEEVRQIMEEERTRESRELSEADSQLNDMIDAIEDEYGANLSNTDERNGFLTMLQRMSPKDKEGNIIEYADPFAVYETFRDSKERKNTRAKEVASRSMAKGGNGKSTIQDDAHLRILRDAGII